ncbi:hypothetical protein [Neisseria wadsworthii]|uniref:hypothetical protein n=1 Tax=Neisseria wadsworthii TaxID=607711 RepID=UPI000D31159C|nr:hypothetical protein [Neisseria wadsworthii]
MFLNSLPLDERKKWEQAFQSAELDALDKMAFLASFYPGVGATIRGAQWTAHTANAFRAWNATRLITVNYVKKPRTIWGKSALDISKSFEKAGYSTTIRSSNRGGRASIVEIKGHPTIQQIQVHPGGGRHAGAYYKISTTNQGIVKVVDSKTYVPTSGEKAKIIYK